MFSIKTSQQQRMLSLEQTRHSILAPVNSLKCGANIGYTVPRVPRFARNLLTALPQPNVVTTNLMKEVALGRVAGPLPTSPFPNFPVSPTGLVPKNQSDKFRTIFHLSFPKSGTL